jgi:PilZ domain-containing protein
MARAKSKDTAGSEQPPSTPERRRALRKRVLWSGQVESNERLLKCAILDVSLQGARVQLAEGSLSQGPIAIAVSRFGTFQAEVVWERESMAGLRFLEPPGRVADTIGRQLPLAMNG